MQVYVQKNKIIAYTSLLIYVAKLKIKGIGKLWDIYIYIYIYIFFMLEVHMIMSYLFIVCTTKNWTML